MRKKKIFTPIIAVGLAMSLSVGSDLDIVMGTTPIENLEVYTFSESAYWINHYEYTTPSGVSKTLNSLTLSFADRSSLDKLVLQNTGEGSGEIAIGNANSVNFIEENGVGIENFCIDFSRNDTTVSKQITLSFGNGRDSILGASFKILNGQNHNDIVNVDLNAGVSTNFIINSSSFNTLTFSSNVQGNIDINTSNSKNIFNFNNTFYQGTLTNTISTDTQINLNNSNMQFVGDINTSGGGITTINFLASETILQGNITANGGSNIFNLSTYSPTLRIENVIAKNSGNNVFNLTEGFFDFYSSSKNSRGATIFSGDSTGKNTLNIGSNVNVEWANELPLIVQSGNMEINIGDSSHFILNRGAPIETRGGTTTINFLGSSGKISGLGYTSIIANGGNNEITFVQDSNFIEIRSNFNAINGINRFVINHNITLQNPNEYPDNHIIILDGSQQSTSKNVFDIYANSSLLLQNAYLNLHSGNIEINFKQGEGKGVFGAPFSFDADAYPNLITINTESQAHGVLSGIYLSNDTPSTNTLNLQEDSNLEVFDSNIFFHTINITGDQANLTLSSSYASRISVLNPILGETLIVNCDGGNDNTLELMGEGNELKALNVLNKNNSIKLYLEQGSTSILEGINLIESQRISFDLQYTPSLTFKNNLVSSGEVYFSFYKGDGAINGDIQSNDTGITTFEFQANGTYSINGMLSTSGKGKNIFDLTNKSATISNDLTFSGNNVSGEGGNIINIGANQNLTLQNERRDPLLLKTMGGNTSINFKETSGSFSGNILASGGNNSITFAKDGTFGFNSTLSTDSVSTNTFTIDKNITISNNLSIEGTGSNNAGTIPQQAYGTFFNIANTSSLTLSNNGEKTSITTNGNGAMTLAFRGSSGSFSGKLIANFSSKSGNNLISFAQSGSFGFDAILEAQQGYNRMEINQDITITTDIYATGASDESVDRGNSFIINNGRSLTLNSDNSKKTIYTQGGETTLSFQKTGSFSGNLNTSNGLLELDFKAMEAGDYTIDLDTDFYAGANGENRIRFYDSTRNLILRSEEGFNFRGERNGNNSIFIGSSGTKISFTNKSNTTQTLTYNGGENTITFANTGQTLEANILNTQGNLTFVFGSNEKGITIGQATINGNITADGGNNTFSFLYDSSTPNNSQIPNAPALSDPTLSMGASSQIIANSTSTNTFTIDKNITFLTDLTLSGNATGNGGNFFNISSGKNLVLQDSSSAIKTLYTTGGKSKITFEGSGNLVANLSTSGGQTYVAFGGESTSVSNTKDIQATQSGVNILTFSGGVETGTISSSGEGSNTLTINGVATLGDINSSGGSNEITLNGGGTLGNVVANGGSNIINLGANISTLSLTSGKSINATQGSNTINVLSQNLTLSGTITSSSGQNHINLNTSGGNLNLTNATFFTSSAKNNHIHLKNSGTFIITTNSTNTNHLAFDLDSEGAKLNFGGDLSTIGTAINFNANNTTLISNITTTAGTTTLTLNTPKSRDTWEEMSAYIEGKITTAKGAETNLVFSSSNQRLILKDDAQITNITHQANNGISFYHTSRSSTDFKTLTIGSKDSTSGISGNGLNFIVYAISNTPNASLETQPSGRITQGNTSKAYADKIVIHSSSNEGASTHNLGVVFENQDNINLDAISYTKGADNNILIASVSNSSKVSFHTQSTQVLGFDVAQIDYVTESTDENGDISGSGYTSYFVGKAKATEVVEAEQEITATAFTLNYDLYMANLNSLNKRMGELRENAHSQGVWARVFNGALSNEFGLGSKSNYTTIQTGYDYAFGFEGANNYLGVALSYALSTSTSQNAFDENGQRRGIDSIYSNAVEVALYNSYVSDSGWYNDSIAKFSYIMSKFDINNLNDNTSTSNDTSNFAFTLSDEVGYVFKLGEAKEWSITPQIEATFGYFSQSDFKQTLANSNVYLDSMAENVLTLRTRVGSAFAYDFKNFTQKDSFNASLYVGAFYEYDYVSGGEIKMSTQRETQTNKYSNLNSDGRVVMNVGTNMSIKDNTRLYFDFERSFAGKITTDYQVNFGVRYSFGESNGYAPMIEKTESKAPLKVEGEEEKEGEKKENKPQEDNEIKEGRSDNKDK